MKLIDLEEVINAIYSTDWYHLFNGELSEGAEDEEHALYKAEDVYKAIEGVPVVDAIPISFIQKRISYLQEIADYEFEASGGYTGEASTQLIELRRLILGWSMREKADNKKSYFPKGFFSKERPLAKGEKVEEGTGETK